MRICVVLVALCLLQSAHGQLAEDNFETLSSGFGGTSVCGLSLIGAGGAIACSNAPSDLAQLQPVTSVPSGANFVQLSVGGQRVCALDVLGAVVCGPRATRDCSSSVGGSDVTFSAPGHSYVQVSAAGSHVCAISAEYASRSLCVAGGWLSFLLLMCAVCFPPARSLLRTAGVCTARATRPRRSRKVARFACARCRSSRSWSAGRTTRALCTPTAATCRS